MAGHKTVDTRAEKDASSMEDHFLFHNFFIPIYTISNSKYTIVIKIKMIIKRNIVNLDVI